MTKKEEEWEVWEYEASYNEWMLNHQSMRSEPLPSPELAQW